MPRPLLRGTSSACAQFGLIAAPPGYSLYYTLGVDQDGLPYSYGSVGHNSVEGGLPMPMRSPFGFFAPLRAPSMLCNFVHVEMPRGCFPRTGHRLQPYFDAWTRMRLLPAARVVLPFIPNSDYLGKLCPL